MNSLRKNLAVISVIAGLIAVNNLVLDNIFQGLIYRAFTKPGLWLVNQAGRVSVIKKGVFEAGSLAEENRRLKIETSLLTGELAGRKTTEKENDFLRNQLGVDRKIASKLIIANIFSIQKSPISSTIIVNKGRNDGISEGMEVISSGNILAGIVSQVTPDSSVIKSVDDPSLFLDVKIVETGILGQTRGLANGNIKIDLISHSEEIENGAIVITAGLSGIKEALVVGQVVSVEKDSGNLFKSINVKMFFDPNLSANVFIIIE